MSPTALGIATPVCTVPGEFGLAGDAQYWKQSGDCSGRGDNIAAAISGSYPTGTPKNSDLEMAAVVSQLNVLEPLVTSMHHNTCSVAQLTKMATKTANLDAAQLPCPWIDASPTYVAFLPCEHYTCCRVG
jgi:hypothetical protein